MAGAGTDQLAAQPTFRPTTQEDLAPSGQVSRVRANLGALRTLRQLEQEDRPATVDEQAILARWGGWGAIPAVFDASREEFAWARDELADLLSPAEIRAAERNTLNAHYTDLGLVQSIWDGVRDHGFDGGLVLEPGCGTGNFIGTAPTGTSMVGVEVDPVSAGIARNLYPNHRILTESFADTRIDPGSIDLVIGNVPFSNVVLTDPTYNRSGLAMHNYFLVKSLHLIKPGGLVAAVTSRYTLDAQNPAARRELAELADLVGAVRLPSGAHQRAAGTQAVTDLLILRRREPDRAPRQVDWEHTRPVQLGEHAVPVNAYFTEHPEMVLGEMTTGHGLYRADELLVNAIGPVDTALRDALASISASARAEGLVFAPSAAPATERASAIVAADDRKPEGHITAKDDGTFTVVVGGSEQPHPVPQSQARELRALLGLRDTATTLLEAEAADFRDTPELDELRAELTRQYDTYVARFGPINRYNLRRTGRTDPETGEERYAKIKPKQGGFRADPYAPAVLALEIFDPTTQTATKADIFSRRVVAARAPRLGADSPADALAICLDTHAAVRLDVVGRLLGVDEDEARRRLGTLVFDEPGTDRLVPAAEYLSGNVRVKLDEARAAAVSDERYKTNVAELLRVVPEDLGPEEISAKLGAAWIGEADVRQFLRETLQDPRLQVQHAGVTNWLVKGNEHDVAATETWGTERAPAPRIAQALLQQRPITVYDKVDTPGGGERRVVNMDATLLAQERASALNGRFSEWLWEDPDRSRRLCEIYNRTFNSIVTRTYDDAELSLPGLALGFEPRSHQVAAVARMINEPSVLLAHEVGAGKTAEMAMGCMELRRLGLVRKPCVVVPNHMLEQFGREWAQLYPQAKLLIASSDDLAGDRRREFIARCATGDWDAVVLTRGAFERIPMSPEAQEEYLARETEALREQLDRVKERGRQAMGVKRIQAQLQRTEEKVKRQISALKDTGISFEATGIDYCVIDEAHGYKNLRTPSNIPGAAIEGSNRASDLDMKLRYIRSRHGGHCATFATATPIANSITEAHVMQRYLRPDLLSEAGIEDFDSWAGTFGESVTAIELSPDGSSFRMQSRFAKFRNVPELLALWHQSADIKTAADLNLATPELAKREDGRREPVTITVPASPELEAYIADLADRAEMVKAGRVDPTTDNMLKVSSDGRAAALDLRLVGKKTIDVTKVQYAADSISAIHADHQHDVYYDSSGESEPERGSLQLVFCDLGTPREGEWSVYSELRDALAERGVPREKVRFMHEARNDREKGELFAACRSGQVAVLIGSTERMGVGTNVQRRAVALHHMDCPWRPADLAQRDGRMVRQGNANPEVQICRYVTSGSFDGYSWQTVARKAEFIHQVMRGRLAAREIEDIGDAALNYNEVKALATGNPLLLDHAEAQAEAMKLERLARGHERAQRRLPKLIDSAQGTIDRLTAEQAAVDQALADRQPTRGDAFRMTIDGSVFTERGEARHALVARLEHLRRGYLYNNETRRLDQVAVLGSVKFDAVAWQALDRLKVSLRIHGVESSSVTLHDKDWDAETTGHGLITRLENQLGELEKIRANNEGQIERAEDEIERSQSQLNKPFARAEDLAAARTQLERIEWQMAKQAAEHEKSADANTDASEGAEQSHDIVLPRTVEQVAADAQPVSLGDALQRASGGPAGSRAVSTTAYTAPPTRHDDRGR